MISSFLLIPALVPGLVSLLVSSFFSRKGALFHHDVLVPFGSGSGSGACLPLFSLLSFLRKGVLFHHDVLALRGSGSGAGPCLPSSLFFPFSGNGVCSIMVLVPPGSGSGSGACLPSAFFLLFSGVISWFFLVPAGVPVLVSLLLSSVFPSERGSVPSWCPGSFWLRLRFRCLFPFFSLFYLLRNGVLFHHDFLVPGGSGSGAGACLPSSFFFLFSGNGVLFPGSGSGSGVCLPSSLFFLFSGKGFCSIMICWLLLVPAQVQVVVSLLVFFFFRKRVLCSIMISWFLLVPVLVPVLVSLLSFVRKRVLFHF